MIELFKKLSGMTALPAAAIVALGAMWIVDQIHGNKPPPALDQAIVTAFGALFAADAKKKTKEESNATDNKKD